MIDEPASNKKVVLVTGAGSGIGRAIAQTLARAGHCVYAGMRSIGERNAARAHDFTTWARDAKLDLRVIEMDVSSELSCREAVDRVLAEQPSLDVVVNNAGMLMVGLAEAFTPEQLAQIIDTNAVSWLRVNRAVLPAMRRQGRGVLVYISSTTARLFEPFIAPYVASKAAGEALAEAMGFEVTRFGVETVIVVPGAFTVGTEHFAHANTPDSASVLAQYGDLPAVIDGLGARLDAIDAAQGGALSVSAVGTAVREVLDLPHGTRPSRIVVDAQKKGLEEINALTHAKQSAFFKQMGIDALMSVPHEKR